MASAAGVPESGKDVLTFEWHMRRYLPSSLDYGKIHILRTYDYVELVAVVRQLSDILATYPNVGHQEGPLYFV